MSGHSQFANIKHRKEKQDKKRATEFKKCCNAIANAIKKGGTNISTNSVLKLAIANAKTHNMSKKNIENAIKSASNNQNYQGNEYYYEGFGPNKISIVIKVITNNTNRISSWLKNNLSKNGGSLGVNNCVKYLFNWCGGIIINKNIINEEKLFNLVVDYDINNFYEYQNHYIIEIATPKYNDLITMLNDQEIIIKYAKMGYFPKKFIFINNNENYLKTKSFIINLLNFKDVVDVYTNFFYF